MPCCREKSYNLIGNGYRVYLTFAHVLTHAHTNATSLNAISNHLLDRLRFCAGPERVCDVVFEIAIFFGQNVSTYQALEHRSKKIVAFWPTLNRKLSLWNWGQDVLTA